MDTQRLILFVIFSFSALMLWEAWQRETRPPVPVPAATTPAKPSDVPTSTAVAPPGPAAVPGAPAGSPGGVPPGARRSNFC